MKRIIITLGIGLPIAILVDCVKNMACNNDIPTLLTIVVLIAGMCLGYTAYEIAGIILSKTNKSWKY